MDRLQILEGAKKRVSAINFGDAVTNVCAGHPDRKHAYFCEYVIKSSTNRCGIVHKQYFARCTDRKGNFWNTGIEVIFAGHLPDAECKELFDPIHKAMYGSM